MMSFTKTGCIVRSGCRIGWTAAGKKVTPCMTQWPFRMNSHSNLICLCCTYILILDLEVGPLFYCCPMLKGQNN